VAAGAKNRNLDELLRDPGYTPSKRDVAPLLGRLGGPDEVADLVERAIVRFGAGAVSEVVRAAEAGDARVRARAARLLGRLAPEDASARARLIRLLGDDESRVRRFAARALGRTRHEDARAALVEAWRRASLPEDKRALASVLGKVGGSDAKAALSALDTRDPELARIAGRSRLMLSRDEARVQPTTIDGAAELPGAMDVVFRCRRGLEPLVVEELGRGWNARVAEPGLVRARLRGPLERAFASRIATSFAIELLPVPRTGDLASDVAGALTSREAREILVRLTRGPIRFRLHFASGGHRRALVWKCAQAIAERAPELVNDPRESAWVATVRELCHRIRVDLAPRALEDPRFSYRAGDVPAASHPTIAAALAFVAGARGDDVVWDPFVGSGLELVERARLGPFARLVGTDVDPRALAVARDNVRAASISNVELREGDALVERPGGVTLILTNPPMGRRIKTQALSSLLDRFLAHAADVLEPGGRLVWMSPRPERTRARARSLRFAVDRALRVDMGGFFAELQRLSKSSRS
jgi:23S rRNA G2445 N2-methylase RlmL